MPAIWLSHRSLRRIGPATRRTHGVGRQSRDSRGPPRRLAVGSDAFEGSEAYCNRSLTSCAAAEKPPHRLLLGGPAYEMAMHKLDELLAEFSTWERLTRSADFPSIVLITPVR
jgi:hypothetical protein